MKLGFISRLYIVKFFKGILFNKISPTRPAKISIKMGRRRENWPMSLGERGNRYTKISLSPLCWLSRSLPWWTRPQFSTNKLKMRCPCVNWFHSKFSTTLCPSHITNGRFSHIVQFMTYLAIWNHQLHISAFEKTNVDSVHKHLRKKQKEKLYYELTYK